MPDINIGFSIQIQGGPQVPVAPIKLPIEAYDKIEVSIQPGTDVDIDIQPGEKAVSFLLIKSSIYSQSNPTDDKKLTYTPEGKQSINLDYPQIYLGTESITTLLGAVKKINFSNKLESDATKSPAVIEILVGRDATPLSPGTGASTGTGTGTGTGTSTGTGVSTGSGTGTGAGEGSGTNTGTGTGTGAGSGTGTNPGVSTPNA